jgi:CTP synthase
MSGLGKGITAASIGRILTSRGYDVTNIKIDPYVNCDAGTLRPTEHGEVFVTDDGGEIDQDLGNYERFLGRPLTKEHNITTGQVFKAVIDRERRGDYLGKTVQPIPHVTDEIKDRIMKIAKDHEITVVEVGGTVGDFENILFLEAARQLRLKLGSESVVFIHVVYVPILESVGEAKTKPAQHSVKALGEIGIAPDMLVCRARHKIDIPRREKMALFCNVSAEEIISNPDVDLIYDVPEVLDGQTLGTKLLKKLGLQERENKMSEWAAIVSKFKNVKDTITIGMVGKYVMIGDYQLADSYISVNEAIKHAAAELGVRAKIQWIDSTQFEKDPATLAELEKVDAVIVPGGFGSTGIEGKIAAVRHCREKGIPYLGLCLGLQMAVVEYARDICGLEGANSTEMDPATPHPVIDILPEQKTVTHKGASMRLGAYPAVLKRNSKVAKLYEKFGQAEDGVASERHRHRYEVNPAYIKQLEKAGLVFSGYSPDRRLMEFLEITNHPYFVATQAHPEFKSRPGEPSPLFYGLIEAAIERKNK